MIDDYKTFLKNEILELFDKEDSICKIYRNDGDRGNGFFIKLNETYIPFNKCLITCYHILWEEDIETGKEINLINKNKKIQLEITKKRRTFTNQQLDYTLIEIFDYDKIEYFFPIRIDPDYPDNFYRKIEVFFCIILEKKISWDFLLVKLKK